MKHVFSLLALLSLVSMTGSAEENFELKSNLRPGRPIPANYYANGFGCSAESVSPALEWKNEPAGTKSFALTVYAQSAPTGSGFTHYVLFDIPADVHKIEEGELSHGKIPAGAVESITDAGKPGYFGPCPPVGRKHKYIYTVYALKTEKLGVPVSATPAFVGFNLWGNTLAKAAFFVTAGPRK